MKKERSCPACHNSDNKTLGSKNGFLLLSCRGCRSLYSSDLPVGVETEDYDEYYTEKNLQVPEFIYKRLDQIIGGFRPFFTNGRLLDIGFGAATLMEVAEKKGWEVYGIEVSKPAVDHAEKLGFTVFHGELQDAEFPDDYFDVVTASEIIEHCPQPEILLNEVFRILRPGGLFWATTPSARGLSYQLTGLDWTTICPPEHLQLFSKKGVGLMLDEAGFSAFEIQTLGFNPFEIIDTYRKRLKRKGAEEEVSFNRVETAYDLNEQLTRDPIRQKIKNLLNGTLNIFGVGDSIKIKAVK